LSTNPKSDSPAADRPVFLCDQMLGSLARWLRFLGYDTLYPEAMPDTDVLRLAVKEGRMLLTRDRRLAQRARSRAVLLTSLELDEQILQLREAIGLDMEGPGRMMRCPKCNAVLAAVSKEEVERIACDRRSGAPGEAIPDGVLGRQEEFWRCPGCGQVYWHGSHYDRIIGKIGELDKGYRV
jgi:uncharacterized protein with PIN domain